MNSKHQVVFSGRRIVALCAGLLASGLLVLPCQSQIATLTDGNSTAMVNLGSSAGMYYWAVNGQNQLNQQWFWYRVGSGAQQTIDQIGGLTWSQAAANVLSATYANSSYNVTVNYRLINGGTGQADIQEGINIQNTTASTLDFYFFQYSDFNLGGTPSGDTVAIDNSNAIQQKGMTAIVEGIIDPSASYYEANTTGGTGSTLYKLVNLSNVQLNNTDFASGDVTWAFEWDLQIPAGQTVNILKDKDLTVTLIPEPSGMILIALGLGAWGLWRRRQTS